MPYQTFGERSYFWGVGHTSCIVGTWKPYRKLGHPIFRGKPRQIKLPAKQIWHKNLPVSDDKSLHVSNSNPKLSFRDIKRLLYMCVKVRREREPLRVGANGGWMCLDETNLESNIYIEKVHCTWFSIPTP